MKRDLDLIRKIMLTLEDKMEYGKNFKSATLFEIMKEESLTIEKLSYHVGLVAESGLIKTNELKTNSGTTHIITTITSLGHDFIDIIRQDTTWNNIKEKAYSIGGSTLSVLIDIGKEYLKNKIVGQL